MRHLLWNKPGNTAYRLEMRDFATLFFVLFLVGAPFLPAQGGTTVMLEPAIHGLLKVHASVAGHEAAFYL